MNERNNERILLFAPPDRDGAAHALRHCSELAASGRAVRVGVIESPYRPGARYGLGCVRSIDPAAEQLTIGNEKGDGPVEGPYGIRREIDVHRTAEELAAAIGLDGGNGPLCLLITLCRMNRIHEISTTDMLAVVDGGASWKAVRSAAGKADLYLPYNAAGTGDAMTAAEVIMGGLSAPTDGRFGRLREHLLSLDLVTPAGELIHTGSRSVKDVGGYDIAGLAIGEGGRCGLVTGATLRLLPAPGSRTVFTARAPLEELRAFAGRLHRRMRPAFIEVYDAAAAAMLTGESSGGDDRPLLVGELQTPGRGAEERLLGEAAGLDGAPALYPGDRALMRNRQDLPALALEALDRGKGVLHCSFEPPAESPAAGPAVGVHAGDPTGSPEMIRYRSLHPERFQYFIANNTDRRPDAATCGDSDGPPRTVSDILSLLGAAGDTGSRAEVSLLYGCGKAVGCRRIHRDEFDRPPAIVPGGGDAAFARKRNDGYDDMCERVLKVFDPRAIMLP